MKYRAFQRLVIQLIPEAQEEKSPGGIVLPENYSQPRNIAHGKVLDGFLKSDPVSIKPGDTVAFSRAGAMNDGKGVYFLEGTQVLAVVED